MRKLSGVMAFTGGIKMQNLLNTVCGKKGKEKFWKAAIFFVTAIVICVLYYILQFTVVGAVEEKRKYFIEKIRIGISSV